MLLVVKRKNPIPKGKDTGTECALINERATDNGGVLEWGGWSSKSAPTIATLSDAEIQALKRKHGALSVNKTRAGMVKACILRGMSISEMVALFHPMGRGYGKRMIAADHSTLFKMVKK